MRNPSSPGPFDSRFIVIVPQRIAQPPDASVYNQNPKHTQVLLHTPQTEFITELVGYHVSHTGTHEQDSSDKPGQYSFFFP
jgi:hypothetical protein